MTAWIVPRIAGAMDSVYLTLKDCVSSTIITGYLSGQKTVIAGINAGYPIDLHVVRVLPGPVDIQ